MRIVITENSHKNHLLIGEIYEARVPIGKRNMHIAVVGIDSPIDLMSVNFVRIK